MPSEKGIKVKVGKVVTNRKIKYIEAVIPMFNVLEVNTGNLDCRIMSMTGTVMFYNETGRFKIKREFFDKIVLSTAKFHEKKGDIFIDV